MHVQQASNFSVEIEVVCQALLFYILDYFRGEHPLCVLMIEKMN